MTKEYGYIYDGYLVWGFASVEQATAAANDAYNGDWSSDDTGLICRYIIGENADWAQNVNAAEIGGCDELLGVPYKL